MWNLDNVFMKLHSNRNKQPTILYIVINLIFIVYTPAGTCVIIYVFFVVFFLFGIWSTYTLNMSEVRLYTYVLSFKFKRTKLQYEK